MLCTPKLLEQFQRPEQPARRRPWCRMHGLDGGAIALLAPRQQPRGSAAPEDAGMGRAEAVAVAESRRMVRAAQLALGALEDLRRRLLVKVELELR